MSMPHGKTGIGQQIEKDILTVLVTDKESESVFDFLFKKANIGRPHSGFMYMSKQIKGIPMVLPDLEA